MEEKKKENLESLIYRMKCQRTMKLSEKISISRKIEKEEFYGGNFRLIFVGKGLIKS